MADDQAASDEVQKDFKMDVSKVSKMWDMLQTDRLIKKSSVLSSCESEIQELMRQIDIMVQGRKAEWEQEKQTLTARLEVREQEYLIQKATLDQKHQEIGQLRSTVDCMERSQRESTVSYEAQLGTLRDEVARVKRDYEKLQRRHQRQIKNAPVEKAQTDQDETEVRKLSGKLEDYRQCSLEWEHEKRALQKQLESLQLQNKSLTDRCNFLSQQSSSYQSQLDRWHDIIGSTEGNLKSQVDQLHSQLEHAQDTINAQDKHIGRLKTMLEDSSLGQRRALQEKEQLEAELCKSHQIVRKLEDDTREACRTIETQDQVITANQEERNSLNREIIQLQLSLQDKENVLQLVEKSGKDPGDGLQLLQNELNRVRAEIKSAKKTEKVLREDIAQLSENLNQSSIECERLSSELKKKVSDLRNLETMVLKHLRNENSKLQEDLKSTKDSFCFEIDLQQKKEVKLNNEIARLSAVIKSLTERIEPSEQQVREQLNELSQRKAEIQVVNAQLHALRLENRNLRQRDFQPTSNVLSESSKSDSDLHVRDMQNAYSESLKTLEIQNSRLESDLIKLRGELQKMEENTSARIKAALLESEKTIRRLRDDENRRMTELMELNRRQVGNVESRLQETVRQYEAKLEEQQTKLFSLEDELELRNRSLAKLGRENEAMSSFVNGVNHIVKSPITPRSQTSSRTEKTPQSMNCQNTQACAKISCSKNADYFDDEDLSLDSADVATEQFLHQQEQRARELESIINFHIEELRYTTDATLKKFSTVPST